MAKVIPLKAYTFFTRPAKARIIENNHPKRVWGNSHVNLENSCQPLPPNVRWLSVKKRAHP